jgi:hypothetical protein
MAQSNPDISDWVELKPFILPHSHAPAAMRTTERIRNGWGEAAKSAGNKMASKAKAVMMRCLSIECHRDR